MLGSKWISPKLPAELIHDNRRPPSLLIVRADGLNAGEVLDVRGLGWIVIRVSSDQLRYRRTTYTTRVEKALLERGMRW